MLELPKSRFFIMALMLWAFISLTALAQGVGVIHEFSGHVRIDNGAGAVPAAKNVAVSNGTRVITGPPKAR